MDLIKLTEDIVLSIVEDKNMVAVKEFETENEKEILIQILVAEKDMAQVIGKNGRTIDSLQTITTAMLKQELGTHYYFLIDVNDYKQRKEKRLEKLAKYTAKDVARTKIEVSLDPMNSYERRIIHNTLSNSKDVYTESVGEEPNRYVVVKPKEE